MVISAVLAAGSSSTAASAFALPLPNPFGGIVGCSCSRCRDYTRALTCTQTHNEYLQNNEEHSSSSLVPQAEAEGQTPWLETYTYEHRHALAWSLSGYTALLPPACAAGVRREKNVAHKMHCSRGHQERHRAMAARCGGGRARYIPKRASTLTNRPACSGRRPTARRCVRGQPQSCTRGGALTHSRAALVSCVTCLSPSEDRAKTWNR